MLLKKRSLRHRSHVERGLYDFFGANHCLLLEVLAVLLLPPDEGAQPFLMCLGAHVGEDCCLVEAEGVD